MSDSPEPGSSADLGRLIEVLAAQAEASRRLVELIESRSLPLLERIATALERAPVSSVGGSAISIDSRGRARGMVEFRLALDESRWDHAESIACELAFENPEDTEVKALGGELERARGFAVDDLRRRIEAAQSANDHEGAIASRDALASILRGEAMIEVDRPLVKWLMALIQRRLRTGKVGADVVTLAGRVAESFGTTTEGASLRASLPTLRRCAGLCPRCAELYAGVGDACPKCLAASAPPEPLPAPPAEDPEAISPTPEPDEEMVGEPIDLNDERFWQNR